MLHKLPQEILPIDALWKKLEHMTPRLSELRAQELDTEEPVRVFFTVLTQAGSHPLLFTSTVGDDYYGDTFAFSENYSTSQRDTLEGLIIACENYIHNLEQN